MKNQKGYSLVEFMVGFFIGLLVLMATTSMAIQYGKSQNSGLGANTALGSGMASLEVIGNSLRQAGFGLINQVSYGTNGVVCTASMNTVNPFAPLIITAGTSSDTVYVAYGTSISAVSAPKLNQLPLPTSLTNVTFYSTDLFNTSDQVIIADSAGNCTTASVNSGKSTTQVSFTGTYAGANPIVGVYPIGTFHDELWSVNSKQQLQFSDPDGNNTIVVAANVVAFKAQFGMVDTSGNITYGVTGNTPTNIKSIRIAVVVKEANRQTGAASSCTTSTGTTPSKLINISDWTTEGTANQLTVDISGVTDWQCFNFKVITQTIPLRNYMWGA